ncbi:HD-GYP domain-containing protein [Rubripirellula obstinata]|uniref:HD-GYP domain-containing protein n=1 Tax=Rubripirellula obstinata TaxID=406547 RepID=UPI00135A1B4E|nr:HD domain-containing phosphohydrolase [Rubripirellula obstinata]
MSKLKIGAVLTSAIVDPAQPRLKLLAAGVRIDEHVIERLVQRGIETVIVSERDLARLSAFVPQGRRTKVPPPPAYVRSTLQNDGSKEVDQLLLSADQSKAETFDLKADKAIAVQPDRRPGSPYADGLQSQWATECDNRIDVMVDFTEDSVRGSGASVSPLMDISSELVDRWVEDADALVALATSPYQSDYPSRHGVHLASLAIAIGAEMGLDQKALIDLGVGCLIHDVGMRSVGVGLFDTKDALTDGQLRRLADHPVKAIDIATRFGEKVSMVSRLVLYQIHERCDGSGYPRGYQAEQIHPLAKIAAVADAFVGMVSTRKHRLAIQGYRANVALLQEVKQKRFDANVVRCLLKATSLHPIGSAVQLNNDHVGRVIRSGGDDFVRPTIAMWKPSHGETDTSIVDLAQERQIQITQSLPAAA